MEGQVLITGANLRCKSLPQKAVTGTRQHRQRVDTDVKTIAHCYLVSLVRPFATKL